MVFSKRKRAVTGLLIKVIFPPENNTDSTPKNEETNINYQKLCYNLKILNNAHSPIK